MISVELATRIIREKIPDWGNETLPIQDLSCSVLGEEVVSDRDYPPFNRVMMDGIALSFKAYEKGNRIFPIVGTIAAGDVPTALKDSQTCYEIMTGAPLPEGTDLVVPYEHLTLINGTAHINCETIRSRWDNIHLEGSDCQKGVQVLAPGQRLNGPHWGIAASMGATIRVKKTPKVMIVSTGDELVEISETPEVHQIRRSNVYALKASLHMNGWNNVALSHLPDNAMAVASHYEEFAPHFDVLIYSGGVSKGKFDYLPSVWSDLGVEKYFHEVSQRPGKPLWFGEDHRRKNLVIGLPGNPVSSLVCLHRYIIPGRRIYVKMTEDILFKKDLTYFVPVTIEFSQDGLIYATPQKIKNSGEFTALAGSDGFIELPRELSVFKKGEVFSFWPWRNF